MTVAPEDGLVVPAPAGDTVMASVALAVICLKFAVMVASPVRVALVSRCVLFTTEPAPVTFHETNW